MVSVDNMVDGYADGDEPMVFHYKKGDFRKREQKVFSDLATGQNQMPRGLFRVLVGTKGNRMIFVTMMLCFALVFVVGLLRGKPGECLVNGVYCEMSSVSIGDSVYVSIRMQGAGRGRGQHRVSDASPRQVYAVVTAVNADGLVAGTEDVSVIFDGSVSEPQFLRATFTDYEVERIRGIITSGGDSATVTCVVEKK